MKTIITRTISGSIFISVLIAGLLISSQTFGIVFLAAMILVLLEYFKILRQAKKEPQTILAVILSVIMYVGMYLTSTQIVDFKYLLCIVPLYPILFIVELYRKKENPFEELSLTILGIIYIGLPFSLLNFVVHSIDGDILTYNYEIVLGFFILTWAYDTAAYLAGISLGKNRLFERISPKKSWEGFVGGCIGVTGIAFAISYMFTSLALTDWLVITVIVIVFATYGDLVESLLKRNLKIKDTSNFLPGHGGVLDRFDAILLSIPVLLVYIKFFT